jgi:hypothetical protein
MSEPFREECIANGTREGNVENTAVMDMPDFPFFEAKLTGGKLTWMNGDLRPRGNRIFEFIQWRHRFGSSLFDASARNRIGVQLSRTKKAIRTSRQFPTLGRAFGLQAVNLT